MSRIILLGDVHGEQTRLAASLALVGGEDADVTLLVGDVGVDPPWSAAARRSGRAEHDGSVREVLRRVGEALACPVVFVPGNHDLPDPPGDLPAINADRRVVEVAGLRIAGLGGAGPTPFGFPYEWSEAEAEAALRPLARGARPDVFLTHTPPARTALDRTYRGLHVGSHAVAQWTTRVRPALLVCGHIHEAWGTDALAGVPCVNAGALGDPYGRALVWIVDWDGGPRRIRSVSLDDAARPMVRDWPLELPDA